jgi:hypothetical protein
MPVCRNTVRAPRADVTSSDSSDQPSHRTTAVDPVEHQSLGARGGQHRYEDRVRQLTVTLADLFDVQSQRGRIDAHTYARNESSNGRAGIGDRAAVHAQDSFCAERRDQTGRGGARTAGHHDAGNIRNLPEQFCATLGIALRCERARASERNDVGRSARPP